MEKINEVIHFQNSQSYSLLFHIYLRRNRLVLYSAEGCTLLHKVDEKPPISLTQKNFIHLDSEQPCLRGYFFSKVPFNWEFKQTQLRALVS